MTSPSTDPAGSKAPLGHDAPLGDYIVYVDESGDHGLERVSPDYPVFVLLFAIFRKADYLEKVCPAVQRFKFETWGHDEVVLHEHELRKPKGDFLFLHSQPARERFNAKLTGIMQELPVTVVAVVIDKPAFVAKYSEPVGPYSYALEAGLERVFRHLDGLGQGSRETPVILECRGRKEDAELELAFRRVCDGENVLRKKLLFRHYMIPKAANSTGLQMADLMARPVGLKHFRPAQPNRAYDIIHQKLRASPAGRVEGWGLKIIP
ncbi:DUF3800 domain-containing protein [Oleiharenicola lentus]|uniref:DUF3800 domain-containing protein n=1 Tax=Oleiharenicola lentus TaxID=2508720 RepID=A0A4Q1C7S4_9BACT|nr:DUF3800 domain-containing protein [Oleiharenicola lentus]RXK54974.1 DUF3800 domain-containing protein [Oleiharenicola lentus]